jgi:hypothetical protein
MDKYPFQGKQLEGMCDDCLEEDDDLVECPSAFSDEEYKISSRFCEKCCYNYFDAGYCSSNIGNCIRADKLFKESFLEYTSKKEFVKMNETKDIFISKERFFAIGPHYEQPETFFEITEEEYQGIFNGREYLLVKKDNNILYFPIKLYSDIQTIFDDYKLEIIERKLFSRNGKYMLITYTSGIWAVVIASEPILETEKVEFISNMFEGYNFFNLSEEDIFLINKNDMVIDWKKIDEKKFVELCRDIFSSFPTIIDAKITDGSHDKGRDIMAIERIQSLAEDYHSEWCIQCKHYQSRSVTQGDFGEIVKHLDELHFDTYCLMTSSYLAPGSYDMIDAWRKGGTFNFKVKIFDKSKIEEILKKNLELYTRYFS